MNGINCKNVKIICYNCGHIFDMALDMFIKESNFDCPECLGGISKDKDKFCKEMVSKEWLKVCWDK